ncbi:MAG: 4Fe-4S dicluster domain-containing protein [Syntrophobacter sp.]
MGTEGKEELIPRAAAAAGFETTISRRKFLILTACAVNGLAALSIRGAWGADAPVIIIENAKGLILADPTRCVGCRRCELACTEFNDGRSQPSLARIKVDRNINFGPGGLTSPVMGGAWGNGVFIQDTCKQCPHPVPCETACPEGAIKADPVTGARVVDAVVCVGCRLCRKACPWDMISFDEESQKATKCFLCHGSPKCVEACPSGAIAYVPWLDLTREVPPRVSVLTVVPAEKAQSCLECHISK